MSESFANWVMTATGHEPYPYQSRLAENGLPDVLRVPTGAGKTLAAVLPWLYRRTRHSDPAVRAATPRWLVFVLPQRALVEQTVRVVSGWLEALESGVPVHVLMGGEDSADREWKANPERERVFIGTQDMVLSRVLMRGFAESRAAWPMSFGLLNNGVQFVLDEVQLMGPGLPTSLQLQGLREAMGSALPCRTMWMSATLDPEALSTIDYSRADSVVELDDADRVAGLRERLDATRTIGRLGLGGADQHRYPAALATSVLAVHRPGTRTLVVVNTVDRAVATYTALRKAGPEADLVLLHSRFRPDERASHTVEALADPSASGTIVVSTQVLEAGIDLTSHTLVTELAPWSSIVQRAGRCNRDGRADGARLLWTPPPTSRGSELPYSTDDLSASAAALEMLEGLSVTSTDLGDRAVDESPATHAVLRRRDLLGLFDTAPDLSGNDVDVGPFIRDSTDRTVSVAWRELPGTSERSAMPGLHRRELCPAPIAAVRALVTRDGAWLFDQREGAWRLTKDPGDVRPTIPLLLDAARGGYAADIGFAPSSKDAVAPVEDEPVTDAPEAMATDPHTTGRPWQTLADHLAETERAARAVVSALNPNLGDDIREAIALAARYHDIGKAHETFVASLSRAHPDGLPDKSVVWAKSPGTAPLRHDPKYFRHELVSALLLLDDDAGLLAGVVEADLVAYLALAHHGKARVSVRAREDEPDKTVLGVRDGSRTVDTQLPNGEVLGARTVSLDAVQLGPGSLADRALRLRDRADLGPFRVALCEALVRAADWQASAGNNGGGSCPT